MTSIELKHIITKSKSLSVLYVEDEEEVRQQTLKMLELCFGKIIVAEDGEVGLQRFRENKVDLIFTDINMAKMDGLGLIENIRKKDTHVPIIVLSAYDYPDYLLTTIKYGVDGYLLKPFKLQEIMEIVEKLFTQERFTCKKKEVLECSLEEGFFWDKETQSLCYRGVAIRLSKNEIALFELLTTSKQRVFSSEEIEIAVFDDDFSDNKRVRNLLSRLRHKLNADIIVSVYGQGYKLRWLHL